jgi:hypothetical protein
LKNIWPHLPKQTLKPSGTMLVQKQLQVKLCHILERKKMIFTDCEKANLLNKYFASVFVDEDISNFPDWTPDPNPPQMPDLHITVETVLKK